MLGETVIERERAGRQTADGARALQLAVVVPVLNEAGNILPMFAALSAALQGIRWEVIFVDDGSTDGTIALIARR